MKTFISIITKYSFRLVVQLFNTFVILLLTFGVGWFIGAKFLQDPNPFGVMFSYIFLCALSGYSIIYYQVGGFDGLSPGANAILTSPTWAGILTIIIFLIGSVGLKFSLLNFAIFLSIVIIQAVKTEYQDKQKATFNNKPNHIKYHLLLTNTLDIFSGSGLITAGIAFLLYQLGWRL